MLAEGQFHSHHVHDHLCEHTYLHTHACTHICIETHVYTSTHAHTLRGIPVFGLQTPALS